MDSKKRLWIYAGLGLAAGVGLVVASHDEKAVGAAPSPLGPPLLARGDRILLVGDSLAQGLGVPLQQLALGSGVDLRSDGRQGTRIDDWAKNPWIDQNVALAKPTLVLVSLGTNDMKMANPLTERASLDVILKKIASIPARILWISPPTMPFPDRGARSLLVGIPSFRSDGFVIQRGPDGIHPTVSAYAGWAGALWAALLRPAGGGLGQASSNSGPGQIRQRPLDPQGALRSPPIRPFVSPASWNSPANPSNRSRRRP